MSVSKVFLTCRQDLTCLKEKQVTLGCASNHTNRWLSEIYNTHSFQLVILYRRWWVVRTTSTHLLCHLWLGAKLKQAACEPCSCLKVLQFEEKIECRAQHQHHVDWLQVAVCEIRRHLHNTHRVIKHSLFVEGAELNYIRVMTSSAPHTASSVAPEFL